MAALSGRRRISTSTPRRSGKRWSRSASRQLAADDRGDVAVPEFPFPLIQHRQTRSQRPQLTELEQKVRVGRLAALRLCPRERFVDQKTALPKRGDDRREQRPVQI